MKELNTQEIENVAGGPLGFIIRVGVSLASRVSPTVRKVAAVVGIIDSADLRSDTPGGAGQDTGS